MLQKKLAKILEEEMQILVKSFVRQDFENERFKKSNFSSDHNRMWINISRNY